MAHDVNHFFEDGFHRCLGPLDQLANIATMAQTTKDGLRSRHRILIGYLRELSHSARDEVQSRELLTLVSQVDELAHLTDALASSFTRIARRRVRDQVVVPAEVAQELDSVRQAVSAGFLSAIEGLDPVIDVSALLDARDAAATALAERLVARSDLDQYVIESDLLNVCARVTVAANRISGQPSSLR
jgi:hypothetical protein